jgi:hypothetical protein
MTLVLPNRNCFLKSIGEQCEFTNDFEEDTKGELTLYDSMIHGISHQNHNVFFFNLSSPLPVFEVFLSTFPFELSNLSPCKQIAELSLISSFSICLRCQQTHSPGDSKQACESLNSNTDLLHPTR